MIRTKQDSNKLKAVEYNYLDIVKVESIIQKQKI